MELLKSVLVLPEAIPDQWRSHTLKGIEVRIFRRRLGAAVVQPTAMLQRLARTSFCS